MKIGMIGLGVMGQAMAQHLISEEDQLFVYNRTKSKAQAIIDQGAIWFDSPKQVAQECDLIFTILGFPEDVESVYLAENGLISHGRPGQILVDMTTSSAKLAKELHEIAKKKGIQVLDAPVSGGDIGASEAKLTIMVGGDQEAYDKVKPYFAKLGKNYQLYGPAGSGQNVKMANQIMIAGTMLSMAEAMAFAKASGLDLSAVIETLNQGAAANWSLANYGPRILKEDYSPGFFIKHFVKDLKIALDQADEYELSLPTAQLALSLYEELVQVGLEEEGTQAIIKHWWDESLA